MSRTTAILTNNQPTYISGGANTQDGNLKLYTCNTCHRPVVWATSARTSRRYLADVFTGASGARYYVKASAHECDRPGNVQARQILEGRLAEIETLRAENDADAALTVEQRARLNDGLDRIAETVRGQLTEVTPPS